MSDRVPIAAEIKTIQKLFLIVGGFKMLSSEAAAAGGGAYNLPGRLIIHKIVVENFKSYAGRQEIGPFDKVEGSSLADAIN